MAFRLGISQNPDLTIVRLTGRLGDEQVARVADVCAVARRPLVLDLSHLTHACDAAVLLLRRLSDAHVHLVGASRYIQLLLADPAETDPGTSPRPHRGSAPARRSARVGTARRPSP